MIETRSQTVNEISSYGKNIIVHTCCSTLLFTMPQYSSGLESHHFQGLCAQPRDTKSALHDTRELSQVVYAESLFG